MESKIQGERNIVRAEDQLSPPTHTKPGQVISCILVPTGAYDKVEEIIIAAMQGQLDHSWKALYKPGLAIYYGDLQLVKDRSRS